MGSCADSWGPLCTRQDESEAVVSRAELAAKSELQGAREEADRLGGEAKAKAKEIEDEAGSRVSAAKAESDSAARASSSLRGLISAREGEQADTQAGRPSSAISGLSHRRPAGGPAHCQPA